PRPPRPRWRECGSGQYLSTLGQMLDLRLPRLIEAFDQPLLQDACDLRRRMQPRYVDEVGAGLIEDESLRNVFGGEHDLRFRAVGADVAQKPQVVRAAEDFVCDARHDQLGVFDARMAKRICMGDVAVDAADG